MQMVSRKGHHRLKSILSEDFKKVVKGLESMNFSSAALNRGLPGINCINVRTNFDFAAAPNILGKN